MSDSFELISTEEGASAPVYVRRIPRIDLLIALILALVTIAAYSRIWNAHFVNLDDSSYVTDNPHIRGEITADTFIWAFTSGYPDNWFPLTRLSHLADYKVFGLNARAHHLVNLFFHTLAAVLLFAFLRWATHSRWPAAVVAMLFAIHPLHVESVAWVSERKDVLCAVFWFATLLAWTWYAERPSVRRYLLALFLFALGLMSKPMIVTLPAVLLLVDWWPLNRKLSRKLLWEKLPFAALAAGDAIATYLVQNSIGAVASLHDYSAGLRIENALTTVAVYVLKMFWPTGLEVLYAYPTHIPLWKPILTGVALCTVTVFVLRLRNCPWLAVGWLWYLVTLIPVIGIVQVGLQARADRYTYVPMVGVSIMIAFSGPVIFRRWPSVKPWAAYIAAAVTVLLGTMTWLQIGYWYSTQTLFRRAIDAAPQNYVALEYLAEELAAKESTLPEAIADYEAAIRIRPDFVQAHNGLGVTFFRMGLVPLAMTKYREAIRINPGYAEAHYDLGAALLSLGRNSEAIPEFRTALRINSSFAEAYNDLGAALLKMPGRLPEAIDNLQRALRINPEYSEAHNNLGLALTQDPRQLGTAIEHFKSAIRIKPRYADAWVNLGMALLRVPNHTHDAILTLEGALRIRPDAQLRRQLDRIEAAESAKGR